MLEHRSVNTSADGHVTASCDRDMIIDFSCDFLRGSQKQDISHQNVSRQYTYFLNLPVSIPFLTFINL